jgi:endonuclease/exonuclease/phosphatase family metal-dependent hydrolase
VARVLTWNVAGRVKGVAAQIEAVVGAGADIVCLQEVTPTTVEAWTAALEGAGLSVAASPWTVDPVGSRRLAVLVASRSPVAAVPVAGLPWPERHLGVRTQVDGAEVEVHTLHAPLSGKPDRVKVRTLEALFVALTADADVPRIVCGDFNTPAYESREGDVQTFARTRAGRIRPDYGERHDQAELLLVAELPRLGWKDAFRALHGYGARDRSYMFTGRKFGWRLDHIVVSPGLEPVACEYVHGWREEGMSDHSAMWAEVAATASSPSPASSP